ncbi:MAG: hypothetical protein M3N07_00955 [Pseudomonadota bacterium]|nr:hypothetical protein [Pseudomonadota bacterium]
MSDPPLNPETLVSLRLAHLSMLQGIIDRLAGNSATAKNFCISLATAAAAIALAENFPDLLWLAAVVIAFFASLDAYYLALERAFRDTYSIVEARPLSAASDLSIGRGPIRLISALTSPSIWLFYLPQLGIVVAVGLLH